MPEPKDRIVSGILRARVELEEVLCELEKLPAVSESAVHFAAHALNNFLTVTGGTVDLLQIALADYTDPQVRTGLESLRQATTLMMHTVSQLINNTTNREAKLRFEAVHLDVMAQRFCDYYQRIANPKQIQLIPKFASELPDAWTDRVATAAVLDNLVSNAVKFSPLGKRIWVQVFAEKEGVVCSVRDEGPGLGSEDQARLFQRGAKLTPKPTGDETSTGYGLAVAREFIEKLGGAIWCESTLGKGSCFSFRLPLCQKQTKNPTQT